MLAIEFVWRTRRQNALTSCASPLFTWCPLVFIFYQSGSIACFNYLNYYNVYTGDCDDFYLNFIWLNGFELNCRNNPYVCLPCHIALYYIFQTLFSLRHLDVASRSWYIVVTDIISIWLTGLRPSTDASDGGGVAAGPV